MYFLNTWGYISLSLIRNPWEILVSSGVKSFMVCLANTCKPKGYFWPGAYPWCREHLQTDRDTVPSVLLPSWYVSILCVPCWEAAAGQAAWEGQSWEWGFCTSWAKTRMAKGSGRDWEDSVSWWGQLSYTLLCKHRKENWVPEGCLWLSVLPPSWAEKLQVQFQAGALTQPSSPKLWHTDTLLQKKNQRTNAIFL